MAVDKNFNIEEIIFSFVDQFQFLLFPDKWSGMFLDYSKNEILALLFLYRTKEANMTEISQYINAPLNTATGVINRLEKKEMVQRIRSDEDRRIVQITLTSKAKEIIEKEKSNIEFYVQEINKTLTDEEKSTAVNIIQKVMIVLKKTKNKLNNESTSEKKVKKINIE